MAGQKMAFIRSLRVHSPRSPTHNPVIWRLLTLALGGFPLLRTHVAAECAEQFTETCQSHFSDMPRTLYTNTHQIHENYDIHLMRLALNIALIALKIDEFHSLVHQSDPLGRPAAAATLPAARSAICAAEKNGGRILADLIQLLTTISASRSRSSNIGVLIGINNIPKQENNNL